MPNSAPPAMTDQPPDLHPTQFWAGAFGTDYTQRNDYDWRQRLPFWRRMVDATDAESFLEVGCNTGANLKCLRELVPGGAMSGVDVNEAALDQAQAAALDVVSCEARNVADFFGPRCAGLAFTCGVLIHIPPEDLATVMRAIVETSAGHVLAVEYPAHEEQEVVYRGHAGKLWKRDYGRLYQDLGLRLAETGQVDARDGFDDCAYWLLEKA